MGQADTDALHGVVAHVRVRMEVSTLAAVRWAMRHPLHALSVVRWVRNLPDVVIAPENDVAGRILQQRFGGIGPLKTGRHAQAALVLPDQVNDYWRGPKRKVFRNKIASVKRKRLTWRMLGPDEIAGAVQAICDGRGWNRNIRAEMEGLLQLPLESAVVSAAFSPDGAVLSVSMAVASGNTAQIRWGLSISKGPARWAVFAGLIDGLYKVI